MNNNLAIETFKEFIFTLELLLSNCNLFDVTIYHTDNGMVISQLFEHINNDNLVIENDHIKIKHNDFKVKIYDNGWQYDYSESDTFLMLHMKNQGTDIEITFSR